MPKELVSLFSRVRLNTSDESGEVADARLVGVLNAEMACLGYTMDSDLIEAFGHLSKAAMVHERKELLGVLGKLSGAEDRHAVLFNGFPYETPQQHDYLVRRILGYVQNEFGLPPSAGRVLACGHVIDTRLFDLAEFGACPICQRQVPGLPSRDEDRHEFVRITPLKPLGLADDAFLVNKVSDLLARPSSLSKDEKAFLIGLVGQVEPVRPRKVFKENLPFAYAYTGDLNYVAGLLSGATDVLRLAVYFSDPSGGDLSLKEPVRFKLSTRHKKAVLGLLERLSDIEADLMRWRERWLRLGERLNPGSAENMRRHPRTAAAFDALRNRPDGIATFNRTVEHAVRRGAVDDRLLALLGTRPGELGRRLDALLRGTDNVQAVIGALRAVAPDMTTAMLFGVSKHFRHRGSARPWRVFLPKGQANKIQVVPDRRPGIPEEILDEVAHVLESALDERLAGRAAMGRIHLDPGLAKIVMPFNRRGDSSTTTPIAKGSRYPMDGEPVVRLFAHWIGVDIDVDLSMVAYDAGFEVVEHISWRSLRGFESVHSGDIQSAPDGASEFIDFDVASMLAQRVRYVVAYVLVYRGPKFSGFPCYAGYMGRDALKSGQRYEPEAVRLKFDLSASTKSHMPVIFDLVEREVVFADMASGQSSRGTIERHNDKLVAAARAVLDMPDARTTAWDVLAANARARGTLVDHAGEADVAYAVDGLDIEAVMAMTL